MIQKFNEQLTKELSEGDINLIVFGETHGFFDDSLVQEEIIKTFKPELFLYEMLEETTLDTTDKRKEFLETPDDAEFSVISTFGELKKTVALADKYKLTISGNDIKDMCRKNKEFLTKTTLTPEEEVEEQNILNKREECQVKRITESFEKKTLVSVGAYHLRMDSTLMKIQENYLLIYFAYNGEQLFEPPENFDKGGVSIKIQRISNNDRQKIC